MDDLSILQRLRINYQPQLPAILHASLKSDLNDVVNHENLKKLFPNLSKQASQVSFQEANPSIMHEPKKVGVVLSGGQAPGGHNVIIGLYDALKKLHPNSQLFGFLDGPKGILENRAIELDDKKLENYRNQGGFDLIGSGRTKIETPEQFAAALKTVRQRDLDGLIIIGGDDSNTNAAFLAEHFIAHQCKTVVNGVPKTIDGDLKNRSIEISFGFDTAAKTYSETIGNICRDTLSSKKAYYFIKLMGRSASHLTLECALQTQPNFALIGEEIASLQLSLQQIVNQIADLICARAKQGKDYGVILIPEGVIEFIPEFKLLIDQLNALYTKEFQAEEIDAKKKIIQKKFPENLLKTFLWLPETIQEQLLLDRDPHGNVQVSKIETERLFIELVSRELAQRKSAGIYKGSFSAQPFFCGYEGRSAFPSNFDAEYCYALGHVAALLVDAKLNGYICTVNQLIRPTAEWSISATLLLNMMAFEQRHGEEKAVIAKALVDLEGNPFKKFASLRETWLLDDHYRYPGPIQFFGPTQLTEVKTLTLVLEH